MFRVLKQIGRRLLLVGILLPGILGCTQQRPFVANNTVSKEADQRLLKQVSYEEDAGVSAASCGTCADPPPFGFEKELSEADYWDMTLDDAIQTALSNSTVLRDLGAAIIQAPDLMPTIYDPSLQATDPRFGEQAALSAFDAQFLSRAFFEKNDRILNNTLLGGGTNFFIQDLWRIENELRKRTATGTIFSLRHNIEDDYNNSPSNIFGKAGTLPGHAWNWNWEAEARQPLLAGRGIDYNQIAGPDGLPGFYNGVRIARINTEISAADFQLALRDYLSNVENAYWELVFAYRELEVRKNARDRALETWQDLKQRFENGVVERDKVAQAAEQYYRFTQEVETALSGRLVEGTRDFNGSTGGTFQGVGGVYVAERRLRLILGLPINDCRLIRPATEPSPADVAMDWCQLSTTSLSKRVELVQQRLKIKRGNLELKASENFIKPDLDLVARYRLRGFSDNLYNPRFTIPMMDNTPAQFVESDKSEWQFGMELNMPVGFRQGHSAVRNAQLALARERVVLVEMERQVIHDLSNALAEKTRAYQQVQTAYNRRTSALEQYNVLNSGLVQAAGRGAKIDFNILLDSERRLAEAESDYHRAVIGYAVALKNVYVETGSLMEYCNVHYVEDADDASGVTLADRQSRPARLP